MNLQRMAFSTLLLGRQHLSWSGGERGGGWLETVAAAYIFSVSFVKYHKPSSLLSIKGGSTESVWLSDNLSLLLDIHGICIFCLSVCFLLCRVDCKVSNLCRKMMTMIVVQYCLKKKIDLIDFRARGEQKLSILGTKILPTEKLKRSILSLDLH